MRQFSIAFADHFFENLAELDAREIHFRRSVGTQSLLRFGHFAIDGHQAYHFFEHAHALVMVFGDRDFNLTGADPGKRRFEFVGSDIPSFGAIDQESNFFFCKFVVNSGKVHEAVKESQSFIVHQFSFVVDRFLSHNSSNFR